MKKFIAILITTCLLLGVNVSAATESITVSSECDISDINVPIDTKVEDTVYGQHLEINAVSAVLMEAKTGKILYEDNADQTLPPASITKIMSLLLVCEQIDNGNISLEEVINASEHACSMGGSQIWLEPNESMTVDDLLKAAVIASANDATVALGERVAGSEEGFVALMNKKAKELGMNSTTFKNCTGLDAEGHLTTANDVAIMSAALISHDLIKRYSTVWMDSLRDGKSELVNTNKLVRFYKGTTGLKTGTTSSAGYCLSATAEKDGMSLVAVIMGGKSSADRFNGAKKLLDYGFANYSFEQIKPDIKDNETVKVKNGTENEVNIKPSGEFNLLLKKTEKANISQKKVLNKNISAPIKKGDKLGRIELYNGDTQIDAIDITATSDVKKLNFLATLSWVFSGLFKP
ncbi:MAG: D-alanyl-D-alanine carboxypeptidase [Clostridia bacterium]|nr:D-alanyl-D-alanine carboxypeptidase [Clostridia bacterium]